ncbi:cysteine-rich receptor-like protein kinase 25 isoform X3 [Rhodamnia argentea]|uniref:Cysteine-rich receptor-like protein kinase 25 isoform X3 n=1 Tax=Rhodamnia argentea TaxID=178133 RepID=A0ABM3H8J7_9MYRT|nr:cysteine-rich receptor-like protein kinase 25 isoform X3 [Rhodamnia argentea]
MSSFFTISLSFLLLFFFINLRSTESAAPTYLYNYCSNATRFAPNSTYQSNLNKLLSSLSSAAAAANNTNGFANATAGQNPPDRAYGLFLCRADVSASTCSDCVAAGTQDILQRCPNQRVSVIWYDECMLRYSNQSIYSVMDTVPSLMMYNTGNISDPTRFAQILGDTMDDIVARASGDESGKKAATAEANFTSLQKLYTLAQCTPDLTASDCNTCLQSVKSNLPSGKQGGRDFSPSCSVRFELYPFYNASAVAAPPPPPSQIPPPPPAPVTRPKGKSNKTTVIIIAVAVPVGVAVVLLFLACCFRRRKAAKTYEVAQGDESGVGDITDVESLQYDLATIQAATDNFSHQNKLGEGGFGEVFQGRLPNGQQIAVKRLSQGSGQGAREFKNEVTLVAKLQHRNLARLLGFCLEGEEKLLVYEFVPNKSLDSFLFDPEKSRQLDWPIRYKIIYGIARGMLYLHEDSRLRIIHRDLKASNILLDGEMNPKISDFGMARIFGVDQTQANTNKIVGTFGYMSPEYAMHGQFSVKSDVYSFGVLLLELISGKKNSFFYETDGGEDLASHAWKNWRDGTPLEVLDPAISDSYSRNEVLRCLHIGLLCVQEDPMDRPTMANIVLMLNSYSVSLALPQQPAFFLRSRTDGPMKDLESDQSATRSMPLSTNEMSVTEVYPR